MQARAPEPGDRIGPYLLERKLGEGGMGLVFEALDTRDQKTRVAVKVLKPESAEEVVEVSRFEREARLASQITSQFVVRLLDAGISDTKLPYIAMELVPARDMAHEIRAGRMPTRAEMIRWMMQILEVLGEAHRMGIVHRDVKPSNILIERRDGLTRAKLADFGISKELAGSKLTETGMFVGTPRYMAPELITNPRELDGRADLWSVGVMLYEYLAGRSPFLGTAAVDIVANLLTEAPPPLFGVDPALASIVMETLEKDPRRRPRSAEALAARLAPFAGSGGVVDPFAPTVTVDAMVSSRGTGTTGARHSAVRKKKRTNAVLFTVATAGGAALAVGAIAVVAPRLFRRTDTLAAPSATAVASTLPPPPVPPPITSDQPAPSASAARPPSTSSAKPGAASTGAHAVFANGQGFATANGAKDWATANRAGIDACIAGEMCRGGYDIVIRANGQCDTVMRGSCTPETKFYRCIAILVDAHPMRPFCEPDTICDLRLLLPLEY